MSNYETLRQEIRSRARALPRAEALRRLEAASELGNPRAASLREELLRLARGPRLDAAARQRCDTLLQEILKVSNYPVRPGSVEQIWYLEGLLDRLTTSD
jgi:hypothetical protein